MNVRWLVPVVVCGAVLATAPGVAVAAAAPVPIVNTGGGPLNVRSGASTVDSRITTLANGSRTTVSCQVYGQLIRAATGATSAMWLRLGQGGFVSDAYIRWSPARPTVPWCAQPATGPAIGRVALSAGTLNIRQGPGTQHKVVGTIPARAALRSVCQVWGQSVTGPAGTSSVWHWVGTARYVADAYIAWTPNRPRIPYCGQAAVAVPPGTTEGFIAWAVGPSKESKRVYRVPTSVTLAQAILESGWGRSGLNRVDHNYFGMKCFGSPGPYAIGCRDYATSECSGGTCFRTTASFRAYRNAYGSFTDHGRQLATLKRYQTAMKFVNDPNRFAVEIHKAGYATSPSYATNLINVMKKYNLYRYDR